MSDEEGCVKDTVSLPVENVNNLDRYRRGSHRERILKYMEDYQESYGLGFSPLQIAKITDIPRKTVAARLSELFKDGKVAKLDHGMYLLNPLKDTGFSPYGGAGVGCGVLRGVDVLPRVQNLRLEAGAMVGVSDVVSFGVGDVDLEVRFGVRNRRVTVMVGTSYGLSLAGFDLLVDVLNRVCFDRGYPDLVWRVVNYEVFTDFASYRLEGCTALTVSDFRGEMIKLYNKCNALRFEFRGSLPLQVEAVRQILMGAGGGDVKTIADNIRALAAMVDSP